MQIDLAQQRRQAHLLLDDLSQEKLGIVHNQLEILVRTQHSVPLSHALAMASIDDEELTPKTVAALERAEASADRGQHVSHEAMLREFNPG